MRTEKGNISEDSPEHSLWKKELPRVAMVERSSTCWSFTTLELAPGPAKILSWASSYRSPTPTGNTATPTLARQQERVYGQRNTTHNITHNIGQPNRASCNPSWPHTSKPLREMPKQAAGANELLLCIRHRSKQWGC